MKSRLVFLLLVLVSQMAWAETLEERARKIVLPAVDLQDVTVPKALEMLRKAAEKQGEADQGMNMLLVVPWPEEIPPVTEPAVVKIPGLDEVKDRGGPALPPVGLSGDTRLVLRLHDVTLSEALKCVAGLINQDLRWDPQAVVLVPLRKEGAHKPAVRPEIHFDAGIDATAWRKPLEAIVLPKVEFHDATMREALELVGKQVQTISGAGVNWVFRDESDQPLRRLNFTMTEATALDVFRYIAESGRYEISVRGERRILYITPPKEK